MRFFKFSNLTKFGILAALMSLSSFAQNHRAPRLSEPEIIESETARGTIKPEAPRYDRERDETTFFLSAPLTVAESPGREVHVPGESQPRRVPSGMIRMLVCFKNSGKTKMPPEKVIIALNAGHYRNFQFVEHRDLTFKLPDGEVKLGPMHLSAKSQARQGFGFISYWETLELPISIDLYRRIINSNSVSMQIGGESASISGSQLKHLREIAKKDLP